jgi:hypothetical protein
MVIPNITSLPVELKPTMKDFHRRFVSRCPKWPLQLAMKVRYGWFEI